MQVPQPFKPQIKVPASAPDLTILNLLTSPLRTSLCPGLNETKRVNRTSANAFLRFVTVIDDLNPDVFTTHVLVDTAPNWAYKKNDTYNVRLAPTHQELFSTDTAPKTEMTIDQEPIAIIRGVVPSRTRKV